MCPISSRIPSRKTERSSFSQKRFFSQFRLKFGRSGGVRGDGMDHTKTLSRTLAGFGLTWRRKVHFSTFDGKLEGSFMTKYPQIGFWISPKAKGFWLNGLRRKAILKNDPQNEIFVGKLGNLKNSTFFAKMASLFMPFYVRFQFILESNHFT